MDRYQGLLENELFLVKVDSNETITESGISKLTTFQWERNSEFVYQSICKFGNHDLSTTWCAFELHLFTNPLLWQNTSIA